MTTSLSLNLDNPIWNGLNRGNLPLKQQFDEVAYFEKDVAPFVGLESYSRTALMKIAAVLEPERTCAIFSREKLNIAVGRLELVKHLEIYQLAYESNEVPKSSDLHIRELQVQDVEQMLALTRLTQPGPFLERTIQFGGYRGVFEGDKLVSMAGFRLNPMPFMEISAVCTHPDYLGRGFASALINDRIKAILEMEQIPFLHVATTNENAIKRYKALGFLMRAKFQVYIMKLKY